MNVATMDADKSLDVRLPFLKQFGTSSLAYSSLQNGMDFFLRPDCGYIAYSMIEADIPRPLCLGDPVCAPDKIEELVYCFQSVFHGPVFIHISGATAEVLSKLGYLINEMGTETILDIQEFDLTGGAKQFLRSQRNRAAKSGVLVKEQPRSEVPPEVFVQIMQDWMKTKANKDELSFLVRPFVYKNEIDVRTFFAYMGDRLVGFSVYDPIYKDGRVIGYLDNIHRHSAGCSFSMPDTLILSALSQFKQEGKEILSLGFSPMYMIDDSGDFPFSVPLQNIFRYLYENANYLYDFKDTAFHKSHYRPGAHGCREYKVYCACKPPIPLHHVDKVFRKIGIDPVKQIISAGVDWLDHAHLIPHPEKVRVRM